MSKDSSKRAFLERRILPEKLRSALTVPKVRLAYGARFSNKLHHSKKAPAHHSAEAADSREPSKTPNSQLPTPSSSKIPWHPLAAVGLVIFAYFAAQLIGGLLVSIYPALRHWPAARANDWLNNSVPAQFAYVVLAEGLMLLPLWFFLKHYKFSPAGLGLKRPKLEDIPYALAGFAVYFAAYAVLLGVVTKLVPSLNVNQPQQVGFHNAQGVGQLVLTAISLVVLPPLVEETLMRGFLYTSLTKNLPKIAAALMTSVIFASAHLEFGSGAPLLWVAAIDTFTLSLVLCYLREKTGRLSPGMLVHALKNSIAFASLFIFHLH